jgi:hypothetical protein
MVRNATNQLNAYYGTQYDQPKDIIDASFPYKQDFTYKNESCRFKFIRRIERLAFQAVVTSGHSDLLKKIVLVKFSKNYSKECHDLFHSLGVSPQLYACEKISQYKEYLLFYI